MSSYIRTEILLFLCSFGTGAVMLLLYKILHLPDKLLVFRSKWRNMVDIIYWIMAGIVLFGLLYRSNYGSLRLFMMPGVAFGGIFANFVLNRLLFLVKRCKISWYRPTKRRLCGNRRSRRFEKVKKEKE